MTKRGPRAEVDALEAEGAALAAVLRDLDPADWARPTRCPPFDVRMIVVHLIAQLEGVASVCLEDPVDAEPEKDRLTWWDYDIAEDQADTVRWVTKAAEERPPGPLAAEFGTALAAAVEACRRRLADDDPIVRAGAGAIRLSDYLATRVLEVTIHAMDVGDAFGRPPAPTREGMEVTLGILAGRLGADPLALGFEAASFALAATGRRATTGAERRALGPLADLLPLLA